MLFRVVWIQLLVMYSRFMFDLLGLDAQETREIASVNVNELLYFIDGFFGELNVTLPANICILVSSYCFLCYMANHLRRHPFRSVNLPPDRPSLLNVFPRSELFS